RYYMPQMTKTNGLDGLLAATARGVLGLVERSWLGAVHAQHCCVNVEGVRVHTLSYDVDAWPGLVSAQCASGQFTRLDGVLRPPAFSAPITLWVSSFSLLRCSVAETGLAGMPLAASTKMSWRLPSRKCTVISATKLRG